MNFKRVLIGSIAMLTLIVGISVYAQVNRPYRNGSVWSISFIRIKPGMDTAFLVVRRMRTLGVVAGVRTVTKERCGRWGEDSD